MRFSTTISFVALVAVVPALHAQISDDAQGFVRHTHPIQKSATTSCLSSPAHGGDASKANRPNGDDHRRPIREPLALVEQQKSEGSRQSAKDGDLEELCSLGRCPRKANGHSIDLAPKP